MPPSAVDSYMTSTDPRTSKSGRLRRATVCRSLSFEAAQKTLRNGTATVRKRLYPALTALFVCGSVLAWRRPRERTREYVG